MEPGGLERIAHFFDSTHSDRLVLDDAFLVRLLVCRLELGLHKPDENRTFSGELRKRGSKLRKADEAQIGHEQVKWRSKSRWVSCADVRALEHMNTRILSKLPVQIAVPHIDCRNRRCAGLKQAIGEPTMRATDICAIEPFDRLAECVERRLKLHSPARDESPAFLDPNICIRQNLDSCTGRINIVNFDFMRQHDPQRLFFRFAKATLNEQLVQSHLFHARKYSLKGEAPPEGRGFFAARESAFARRVV